LASNFWLANNTTLAWTSVGGLSLSNAGVTVGSGANLYQFSVSGNYNGTSNWSLSVDSGANSWPLGGSGTVPISPDDLGMPAGVRRRQHPLSPSASAASHRSDDGLVARHSHDHRFDR
jgi:hypothetical protein